MAVESREKVLHTSSRPSSLNFSKGVESSNLRSKPKSDHVYGHFNSTSCGLVNCQSLNKNLDIILHTMYTENIKICALTETWIKDYNINNILSKFVNTEFSLLSTARSVHVGIIFHKLLKVS